MNYSIPNLFLDAFGLKIGGIYKPEISDGKPNEPNNFFKGLKFIEDEDDTGNISASGTQILFPLVFQSGSYKKYNNIGEIIEIKKESFRLPIASIVSFQRNKIMTETKLNGGRGSVKEIYGFDDWQITINGFLIPDDSQPQNLKTVLQQEKELKKWDDLCSSIPIFGKPFSNLNINNITIKGISFDPMRGRPKIKTFTINAVSDEPIELNIKSQL